VCVSLSLSLSLSLSYLSLSPEMGKTQSKPKKGKKDDNASTGDGSGSKEATSNGDGLSTNPQEDQQSTAKKNPLTTTTTNNNNNNVDDDADAADQEDKGGWDEPVLYSQNNQKVGKDDFELLFVIGKGSFGKVMQVKKKDTGKIYAMKVLRKETIIQRKQVAHTRAEKAILQMIQHPFIVTLHYAFQTEEKLYMVLDYINGGELFFHLKKEGRFNENRVRFYAAEITCALCHLHSYDIVYRDLKPENILLDSEGHICITDFGLSKELTQGGAHTFCGTPEYLAPEVLKGQGHGVPVDWWSLGTLIFEMLVGLPPFYSQNVNIMYQKILSGELKIPSYLSPEAQSLLTGLLNRDVAARLGDTTIKQHPFFKPIDWEKLEAKKLEAPFKPKVKDASDIGQIDPVFTQETVVDSLVEKSAIDSCGDSNTFDNFTFVNESAIGAH